MRVRGIFVAGVVFALSSGMPAAWAQSVDYLESTNATPVLPDPVKQSQPLFAASAATAGSAIPSPALGSAPELDARACTAQSHCALPSPALQQVIVTPQQITVSRVPIRKHRG